MVRGRRHLVRGVRPPGPHAVEVPGRPRRRGAAGGPLAGSRRRAARAAARALVPRPGQGSTDGRSCGSWRWPSRTSSPSRSPPSRSARRSRGAASATPRWAPGPRVRPRCCSPMPPATTAEAAGETVFAKGGPSALADALASAARAAGAEIRTSAKVDGDHDRGRRRHRRRPGLGRGDRGACGRLRPGPEAAADLARRSGDARPGARAGGPATSGRPGTLAKVNLVLDGLPELPGRPRRRAAAARPDPGRHHLDRRDGARVRRVEVRASPGVAGARGHDPVARGSVAGRGRARRAPT